MVTSFHGLDYELSLFALVIPGKGSSHGFILDITGIGNISFFLACANCERWTRSYYHLSYIHFFWQSRIGKGMILHERAGLVGRLNPAA